MKKIDIHCHLAAFPELKLIRKNGTQFLSAEEQMKIHDEIDVDIGVLLPVIAPEGQYSPITNEDCQLIVKKYPDRFTWFCNVDPRQLFNNEISDLSFLLNQYKEWGAKGLGELTTALYTDDPMMENLFASCQELSMPVLIHMTAKPRWSYGIIDDLGLPRLEKMLKKFPKLKIIGHSQCFWSEISADVTEEIRGTDVFGKVIPGRIEQLMSEYENLYCDISAGSGLSAISRDPEYTASFFEKFADRIYFGTDTCAKTNTHQYELNDFIEKFLADGMVSRENYEKIIRKNAEKLLGLDKK